MTLETEQLPTYELPIGGTWEPAGDGATYEALNPFTGEAWARVPDAGRADVDRAVAAARAALNGPWGQMTGADRAGLMRRLAVELDSEAQELAALETRGNGKLIRETSGQARALSAYYNYFAGLADKLEGASIPAHKPGYLLYTEHMPVGVVAAIMAWNSPLLLMTWKVAPALAAGCTIIAKPSPYTPVSTLRGASSAPGFRRACSTCSPGRLPSSGRRWPDTRASTRSRSPAPHRPGSPSARGRWRR
jgi:acyl-CoA reductase-like NAD-dependent aldehyde dehydrogenase